MNAVPGRTLSTMPWAILPISRSGTAITTTSAWPSARSRSMQSTPTAAFRRWRPSSETSTWSTSKRDPCKLVARRTPILPPAPSNAIFAISLSSLASGLNAADHHGAEEVGRADLSVLEGDLTLGMGRIVGMRATERCAWLRRTLSETTLVYSGCDQHHESGSFLLSVGVH